MPNFVITAVAPSCGQRDEARFDAESMAVIARPSETVRYLSPICGRLGGSAIRVMTPNTSAREIPIVNVALSPRTTTCYGTRHPVWDESFGLDVNSRVP